VTERVCKTCCWWNDSAVDNPGFGQCELEPVSIIKIKTSRCRHHSFTTGWLEEEDYPSNLDAKVKALSERCKEARRIMVETGFFMGRCPTGRWDTIQTWLAGDDE